MSSINNNQSSPKTPINNLTNQAQSSSTSSANSDQNARINSAASGAFAQTSAPTQPPASSRRPLSSQELFPLLGASSGSSANQSLTSNTDQANLETDSPTSRPSPQSATRSSAPDLGQRFNAPIPSNTSEQTGVHVATLMAFLRNGTTSNPALIEVLRSEGLLHLFPNAASSSNPSNASSSNDVEQKNPPGKSEKR